MEGVGVFEVDGDGEELTNFGKRNQRIVAEELGELDGGEEALDLVLPGLVPFIEGVFGGGGGKELDGRGLVGQGGLGGGEDGRDCGW